MRKTNKVITTYCSSASTYKPGDDFPDDCTAARTISSDNFICFPHDENNFCDNCIVLFMKKED